MKWSEGRLARRKGLPTQVRSQRELLQRGIQFCELSITSGYKELGIFQVCGRALERVRVYGAEMSSQKYMPAAVPIDAININKREL